MRTKTYPVPLTLYGSKKDGSPDVNFFGADIRAEVGFRVNIGAIAKQRGALAEAAGQAEGRVLNADQLKALVGEGWREPFISTEDGPKLKCGLCATEFQPMLGPTFKKGEDLEFQGGSFATIRRSILEEDLKAKLGEKKPKLVERIISGAQAFTLKVVGEAELEEAAENAVVIPLCDLCKPAFPRATFVSLASAKDAVAHASAKIGIAGDREAIFAALGRQMPRPVGGGAGASGGRRFHNGHRPGGGKFNRRNDRDRGAGQRSGRFSFVDWNGASVLPVTAEALTKAGYTSVEEALKAAENGELLAKGVAHPGNIAAIAKALGYAKGKGTIVGSASAVSATAPAAGETAGTEEGTARPKRRKKVLTVTAAERPAKRQKPASDHAKTGAAPAEALA